MKKLFVVSAALLAIITAASSITVATAQESARGSARGASTQQKNKSNGYAAEVTASRLQLRAGASSSYQSVLTVDQGTKLVVTSVASGEWATVHVPGGFNAWVSAKYVKRGAGGMGTVTGNTLNIRPRPTTRYHQLAGKLLKGESVKIVDEKLVGEDRWLKVRIPQRVPLYASIRFLKNIGPASLAVSPAATTSPAKKGSLAKKGTAAGVFAANANAKFIRVEKSAIARLKGARSVDELRAIERTLATVDQSRLTDANRKRHLELERKMFARERDLAVSDVAADEAQIQAELDRRIKAIESKYAAEMARNQAIRDGKLARKRRYTAVGIIELRPDVLGRTPAYRLKAGGKLKFFLIAPAYDLRRFSGKRVGVIGVKDRESGTGYFTIMVKRIEIIGDK